MLYNQAISPPKKITVHDTVRKSLPFTPDSSLSFYFLTSPQFPLPL